MAEKEYIPIEEIEKHFGDILNTEYVDDYATGFKAALKAILSYSTVDVTPIRHGYWIDKPYPNYPAHDIRYCSECSWNIHKSKLRDSDLNWSYCPNCGADMRGE